MTHGGVIMRTVLFAALAALSMPALVLAATDEAATETAPDGTAVYEAIDSFPALGGLYSFEPLDRERLIVWRTPFEPYLVELKYPSIDLRFAHAIAIDSATSSVHSRFDSVLIRGIKYPIGNIWKLSREQARAL